MVSEPIKFTSPKFPVSDVEWFKRADTDIEAGGNAFSAAPGAETTLNIIPGNGMKYPAANLEKGGSVRMGSPEK